MGFIGYYLKKDKWWGLFILTPILLFLGYHYNGFLSETLSFFPNHLISTLCCLTTLIIYPLYIFKNKKVRIAGIIISIIIIITMSIFATANKSMYNTTILISSPEKVIFDNEESLIKEGFGKFIFNDGTEFIGSVIRRRKIW